MSEKTSPPPRIWARGLVRPLDWQTVLDPAGHEWPAMRAICPMTGRRIWGETEQNRARQERMHADRVLAALDLSRLERLRSHIAHALTELGQSAQDVHAIRAETALRRALAALQDKADG